MDYDQYVRNLVFHSNKGSDGKYRVPDEISRMKRLITMSLKAGLVKKIGTSYYLTGLGLRVKLLNKKGVEFVEIEDQPTQGDAA